MPIINNHVEFSHLIRYNYTSQNPTKYNRESIFFELARLILSFDEQLETISKFKELIKKSLNKVKIDEMLTELNNVMSLHEQSKPAAVSLFELYQQK
jgi:ppGpp synthetase/RelA/SpoT-type nucleotidyltranferase